MDFCQPIYRRCIFSRVMQNCHSQTDTVLILASGKALAISTADISSNAVVLLIHTGYIRFSRYINIALFYKTQWVSGQKNSRIHIKTWIDTLDYYCNARYNRPYHCIKCHSWGANPWLMFSRGVIASNKSASILYWLNISMIHHILDYVNNIFLS